MSTGCISPPPLSEDDLFTVLDDSPTAATQSHLVDCMFCRERLAQLHAFDANFIQALGVGVQARADFERSTAPWFRDHAAPPVESRPSLWEQAVGMVRSLIPSRQPILAGLRGDGDTVHRLSAESDGITLLLEGYSLAPRPFLRLKGMVMDTADATSEDDAPARWAGALAELRGAAQIEHVALLDERAEFELTDVTAGTWNVYITAAWGDVLLLNHVVIA